MSAPTNKNSSKDDHRPDIVVDEAPAHTSRKVARDAKTKNRGGLVTVGDRAQFGGKENKDKYGAGVSSLRHDGWGAMSP